MSGKNTNWSSFAWVNLNVQAVTPSPNLASSECSRPRLLLYATSKLSTIWFYHIFEVSPFFLKWPSKSWHDFPHKHVFSFFFPAEIACLLATRYHKVEGLLPLLCWGNLGPVPGVPMIPVVDVDNVDPVHYPSQRRKVLLISGNSHQQTGM